MARKLSTQTNKTEVTWDVGKPNEKQLLAMKARTLYVGYGGAKGGGKTWFIQRKAIGAALDGYPGIKILIMRAHYPELEDNHINPIKAIVAPLGVASYNGTTHLMTFDNGSTIKFGHWNGDESEAEYAGLEFDWIFMDEATQFSERAFNYLGGCLRGTNDIPKRMYITCNPGGVGHRWVKRLFIDKNYKTNCKNPEENENPADYTFIFATVEDNKIMLEKSPTYLRTLANMPEDLREAYRYGNWDAIGGNYFKEFNEDIHVVKEFSVPKHWHKYRSLDYGLDMCAVGWWAVDEDGRSWLYRSYEHKDLIVSDAAKQILAHTLPGENIELTYAPPDLWSRMKDTGHTMAETFAKNGVVLFKSDNNRVQGHMLMKEALAPKPLTDPFVKKLYEGRGLPVPAELPMMMFMDNCTNVTDDIRDIQADETNPNDCAKQPHEVTHEVDQCRYYITSRTLVSEAEVVNPEIDYLIDGEQEMEYEEYMVGGEITAGYMAC